LTSIPLLFQSQALAWEAGRKYKIRVNTISAGPLKSRAASAISKGGPKPFIEVAIDYCRENAPLNKDLFADDVGSTAAFLLSDMSGAVTGHTLCARRCTRSTRTRTPPLLPCILAPLPFRTRAHPSERPASCC
jgi:enoyl-[acyl-carrier-protein] reductase (NADH)